jgi:hypothetical protein
MASAYLELDRAAASAVGAIDFLRREIPFSGAKASALHFPR